MGVKLEKRSKVERMIIAETLLSSIWEELLKAKIDDVDGLLQLAVSAQVSINRIVWKLNELNGAYLKPDRKDKESE